MYIFKLDTESDCNLVPNNTYKSLFLYTNISNLNKFIKRKIVLNACNNSCIPQMGICHNAIINKGNEY